MADPEASGRPRSSAMPRFDPTFNWGHVLIALTLGASAIMAYSSFQRDLGVQDVRILANERRSDAFDATQKSMALAIERLSAKAIVDAAQDEQIRSLDRRVGSLEGKIDRLEQRRQP